MDNPHRFTFDTVDARQKFEAVNETIAGIGEQNGRFARVDELQDAEFEKLVGEALVKEQHETLAVAAQQQVEAPYDEVARQSLSFGHALDVIAAERVNKQAEVDAEHSRINNLAAKAIALTPRVTDVIQQHADQRKAVVLQTILGEGFENERQLLEAQATIDDLYDVAGQAWPVPHILGRAAVETLMSDSDNIIYEQEAGYSDQVPVEPGISDHEHEVINRLREHHVDAPQASLYITLYLSDRKACIVTVKDLADFLYSRDVESRVGEHGLRSRVTTMLGPKIHRQHIRSMLAEEGLALQYGWRYERSEGKSVGPRKRIYRAIDIEDDSGLYQKERYEQEMQIDEFLPADRSVIESLKSDISPEAPADTAVAVKETLGGVAMLQNIDVQNLADESETSASNSMTKAESQQPAAEDTKKDKDAWKRAFKQKIGNVIAELESDQLMVIEPIKASVASARSSSTIMGTRTAMQRMMEAGLLASKAGMSHQELQKLPLTVKDLILMKLLNTSRRELGRSSVRRQKEAVDLVEQAIGSYFTKRAEEERGLQNNS